MAFACRRVPLSISSTLQRSFSTTSCLSATPETSETSERRNFSRPLPPPSSQTFYTGRSSFYDYVASLERAVHHTRSTLKVLQLIPLPEFALRSLPLPVSAWKTKEELATALSATLSASRHRRLIELLNQLSDYRRIAQTAGHADLTQGLDNVLEMFERDDKEQHLRRGQRKPVTIDDLGRTYTNGRRKTSSARVWMISSQHATEASAKTGSPSPPITEIIVNNTPINEYFKAPIDRERILRPFRLTGLLGAYNAFALVRGGGISGQAGAVALGIAKGLAAHVPDVELILRRAKLLRRDPRMVERKKTGRAKARKGYTWVKR